MQKRRDSLAAMSDPPARNDTRTPPNTCTVIHDQGSEEMHLNREKVEKLLAGDVLLARPRPARSRTTSRSCATSSSSIRSRSRTPRTSASGRRSTTTTTSSSSSSTAPTPTRTGSSRCTASTPSDSSSPSTATTAPRSARSASATRSGRSRSTIPSLLLYRIVDGLVDSFFPILADFDDRIDELENAIFLTRRRRAAPGDLRDEAAARRHAQGGHAAARRCSRA